MAGFYSARGKTIPPLPWPVFALPLSRVTAGMKAAAARGKHLGRPRLSSRLVEEIETLATSTVLSIRKIQEAVDGRASRGRIGEIVRQARSHNQSGTRPIAPEDHP
uniref:Uncharacterized protein n=2 Tax=Rhizobium meliloti TaxID=382 RepID=A4KVM0_SINMM|nr:hypothetical protein [Sinorhizobium meliloti SM11]